MEPPASGSFFAPDSGEILTETHTPEDVLELLLRSDRGKEVIKPRVYQFVTEQHPVKAADLVPVLKNAYGIGGAWSDLGNGLKRYMSTGKGIELGWIDANGQQEAAMTWNKVAAMVLRLIQEGHYDDRFAPFPPPEEAEWTLFDYAAQVEEQQTGAQTHPSRTGDSSSTDIEPTEPEADIPAQPPINRLGLPADQAKARVALESPPVAAAANYRFHPENSPYVSGPKNKYKRNVEAIRLLKQLEAETRYATPEEQQILAVYVGWGGLANAFHPSASGWEAEYTELKQLLDEAEYAAARNSTITAFYTEQAVIRQIHDTLRRFGLADGVGRRLLEPSMGTGNFFSALPPEWDGAELHGVELDSLTGRISRQLYPQATIHLQGFETVNWRDLRFDAMFSNIPFHNIRIHDRRYTSSYYIHDYFFIRSLDLLKPGGILAYIVSKGTMDKQDSTVRQILAQQAELIGMVRLPNTTFQSLLKSNWNNEQVALERQIKQYPLVIQNMEQKMEQLQADVRLTKQTQGNPFEIELDGKTYMERPLAGEMLLLLSKITILQPDESIRIGTYRGFDLSFARHSLYNMHLEIKGAESYAIDLGESELGNISRIENAIEKIPVRLHEAIQKQSDVQAQWIVAQTEVGRAFEFEQNLQEMVVRQSEINSVLEFKELREQEVVMEEDSEGTSLSVESSEDRDEVDSR